MTVAFVFFASLLHVVFSQSNCYDNCASTAVSCVTNNPSAYCDCITAYLSCGESSCTGNLQAAFFDVYNLYCAVYNTTCTSLVCDQTAAPSPVPQPTTPPPVVDCNAITSCGPCIAGSCKWCESTSGSGKCSAHSGNCPTSSSTVAYFDPWLYYCTNTNAQLTSLFVHSKNALLHILNALTGLPSSTTFTQVATTSFTTSLLGFTISFTSTVTIDSTNDASFCDAIVTQFFVNSLTIASSRITFCDSTSFHLSPSGKRSELAHTYSYKGNVTGNDATSSMVSLVLLLTAFVAHLF